MEENLEKKEQSEYSTYDFFIGIFSIILIFAGFFGFLYSIRNIDTSLVDDYFEIKKGTTWTNGNNRVQVIKVYKNRVIYTKYSYSGRVLDTCTLSKRVFFNRYTKLFDEGEI